MLKKITGFFNRGSGYIQNINQHQPGVIRSDATSVQAMRQKEKIIYGEDKIAQQRLYEKWAVKSSWHLRSQAIPLLLSIDPEQYLSLSCDESIEKKYKDLWEHAQRCVDQELLVVLNSESPADEWQANPVDVYKWATVSRVRLPQQLSTLMEFVMSTMITTDRAATVSQERKTNEEFTYSSDKERMLGAALSILASYPEDCKNKKGQVKAEKILLLINKNQSLLFGKKIPDLSATAGLDIINLWLQTTIE